MKRVAGWSRAAVAAAVVGVAAGAFMLHAAAAPAGGNKNYSAWMVPSSVPAGSTTQFKVTVENCGTTNPGGSACSSSNASTQYLGSANVSFPSSFTRLSLVSTSLTTSGGKPWTAALLGNVVQLRNNGSNTTYALAPGQSVTVTVNATTPSSCGSSSLTTETKQSNDFSGPPGNGFNRVGSEPSVLVSPGPLDHFVVSNPGSVTAGSSFPVTITAIDTCGQQKTDYTGAQAIAFSGPHNAPDTTPPSYPSTVSFNGGVATATIALFDAETTALTASQGSASGSSGNFTVNPGPAKSFSIPNPGAQTAGQQFSETLTALDQWKNVATGYTGSQAVTFTGPDPAPDATPPSYPPTVSFGAGVGTASITLFDAETTSLTATQGAVTGTSGSFTVNPGSLQKFTFSNPGTQTAGAPFTETITAGDTWGNTVTSYAGSQAIGFSGPHDAPDTTHQPSYPPTVSFGAGVGTASITLFDAETTSLTASQGAITGSSGSFTVQPADPATLTFIAQPNDTQPFSNGPSCNAPAVCQIATQVKDLDPYGNPEAGVAVSLTIDPAFNPGADKLTALTAGECVNGTCTQKADSSGVASFPDLTMHNIATGYELLASSPPTGSTTMQDSSLFNVAQTVIQCKGSCKTSATDKFDNITATATGVSGNLSIAIENSSSLPASCGITTEVGNLITINPTNPTGSPTLEVTGTLLHKSNKGGIGNSIICKDSGPGTPFHQVPMCNKTNPTNSPPCLVKLSGNGQGDIFFDLIVKATPDPNNPGQFIFDPKMGGGG